MGHPVYSFATARRVTAEKARRRKQFSSVRNFFWTRDSNSNVTLNYFENVVVYVFLRFSKTFGVFVPMYVLSLHQFSFLLHYVFMLCHTAGGRQENT